MDASKSGPGKEQAQAGSGPSEDDASPEVMTPEQEAQQESEQHITELLKAYTRRPWTRSRIFPR